MAPANPAFPHLRSAEVSPASSSITNVGLMDDVNGLGKEVQYLQIKSSRSYPQPQNKHMYIFYTYSVMNII